MSQPNHKLTANARKALNLYLKANGSSGDLESDITDLVADMLHLAHSKGINTGAITLNAEDHFEEETRERQANALKHGRAIKGFSLWETVKS